MKKQSILRYAGLAIISSWSIAALAAGTTFTLDQHVDQRGFTGDGDWDVGRTKAECASLAAVTGLSTDSFGGPAHSILCLGPQGANNTPVTVDFAFGDSRRDTSTGDWDPGFTKGECASNERVIGISEDNAGPLSRIQCARATPMTNCHTVVFANGDNRGTTSTGDWAPGFFKGECRDLEAVKGVSKVSCGGAPHAILCCHENFTL